MFGNLGSRNLFEVRELNYFTGSSPPSPSSRTGSSSSGSSGGSSSSSNDSDAKEKKDWQTTYSNLTGIKFGKDTQIGNKTVNTMTKVEMEKALRTATNQHQAVANAFGVTTVKQDGSVSATPDEKVHSTLKEQMEAKAKATQEFREKWHGIRDPSGKIISAPTATKTDVVQALLNSNNQHFGTDTRNLEQYLTKRDYDISAISAGEVTIPENIFMPNKQEELRKEIREQTVALTTNNQELLKELEEKRNLRSNFHISRDRNNNIIGVQSPSKDYQGFDGLEKLDNEIEVLEMEQKYSNTRTKDKVNELNTELAKIKDENTIRATIDKAPEIPKSSINLLPIILIAVVGLIAIYLIRRKK